MNNNTKRVGWAVCKARGMVGVGNKAVQPPWSLSLGKSTNGPSGPGVQTVSRRYILMEWGRWGRMQWDMLPHSICTGSHSRIGPERGHLYSHLQGVPVVPGREEPHGLPAIPGNSDGLQSQHLLIHPGNRGGDGQGGRAREMPSHSVQIASHPVGASLSRDFGTGIVDLSHNLPWTCHFQLSEKSLAK